MYFVLAFLLAVFTAAAAAPPTASLVSSVESPVLVGEEVLWVAEIPEEEASGNYWFRFRVREQGGDFRTVKDFSPYNSLTWADIRGEGEYEIEVSIRDNETGESISTSRRIVATSRVVGGVPSVAATSHPLVRIYSAPACPAGSTMSVRFTSPEGDVQRTPPRSCTPDRSMNFYLAGLRPLTEYRAVHTVTGPEGAPMGRK